MKRVITKLSLFISLSVILSALITSCSHLEKLVHKPEVKLTKVSVDSISKTGLVLKLTLIVTNKNSFDLKINDLTLAGSIQDKTLITQKLSQAVTLKANGSTPVEMPVTIKFKSLFSSIASITKLENVGYNIKGKLTVQDYFDIPYSKTGKIKLNK